MESAQKPLPAQSSLFQVYLRLRPPINQNSDAPIQKSDYLTVEAPLEEVVGDGSEETRAWPTHITVQPPNESRKRAVERFAFTRIFEERATQLDVFDQSGMLELIKGVLDEGRDGLVATLGTTGSGKV